VNTSGDDVKPSTHTAHTSVGLAHINEVVVDKEPLYTDLGEAVILLLTLYYVLVS